MWRRYIANSITIAIKGKVPCVTAAQAMSGDDGSITAASSIDIDAGNSSANIQTITATSRCQKL